MEREKEGPRVLLEYLYRFDFFKRKMFYDIYIYTRQRVIKRSYVIDCANKHLSDWELQLVSERDEITNAGYRDSNFSKMHRQKKFYVNIYIYIPCVFIYIEKKSDDFYGFSD